MLASYRFKFNCAYISLSSPRRERYYISIIVLIFFRLLFKRLKLLVYLSIDSISVFPIAISSAFNRVAISISFSTSSYYCNSLYLPIIFNSPSYSRAGIAAVGAVYYPGILIITSLVTASTTIRALGRSNSNSLS